MAPGTTHEPKALGTSHGFGRDGRLGATGGFWGGLLSRGIGSWGGPACAFLHCGSAEGGRLAPVEEDSGVLHNVVCYVRPLLAWGWQTAQRHTMMRPAVDLPKSTSDKVPQYCDF